MACWSSTVRACSFVAVAALSLLAAGCRTTPLPVYGKVPDFKLTSQTGAEFHGASLDGSVWVAEFFFTHCTGPCPRMNSRFRQIEKKFERQDLKLVSMTVDPARDTVPVLAAYAKTFSAEPGRWFFLTGPLDELNHLGRTVFLLGDVNGNLDHSTRFVLVDRRRTIRGFYRSEDVEAVQQLMRDIEALLKEQD
jgi:protein SCO1/2